MLYVVPTPIGNLEDITFRAVRVLKSSSHIVAENPAHSSKLVTHFDLGKKIWHKFAEHNEREVLPKLVELASSEDVCLVTDAGTPCISDPGFRLVRECRRSGVDVVALPGACALTTALSGAGLPTDKFTFIGFLPKTPVKVSRCLEEVKSTESTLVAYESPNRILKSMELIASVFPDVSVVLAREISKLHEEYLSGTALEVLGSLKLKPSVKGEFVLIISF